MSEFSEFSRRVALDRVGSKSSSHEIAATQDERAALAKRFDLVSLENLAAVVRLERVDAGRAIKLTGQFHAKVVQACVVTLDLVAAEIADKFAILYALADDEAGEVEVSPDPADAPLEPLPADAIDIGEAVAQQLSLSIDPYPRAPSARLDAVWPGAEAGREDMKRRSGPFAALQALKSPPKSGRS